MPFEFGDVVLVPFPFTNQTSSKKRPAVVVSGRAYNVGRPDLVMMPITSQVRQVFGVGDIVVQDWRQAGLLARSAVKPVVMTLEQGMVIRRLGAMSIMDVAALRGAIARLLA